MVSQIATKNSSDFNTFKAKQAPLYQIPKDVISAVVNSTRTSKSLESQINEIKNFNKARINFVTMNSNQKLYSRLIQREHDIDLIIPFLQKNKFDLIGFVGWGKGCIGEIKSGKGVSAFEGFIYKDGLGETHYQRIGSCLNIHHNQFNAIDKSQPKNSLIATKNGDDINFNKQLLSSENKQEYVKINLEISKIDLDKICSKSGFSYQDPHESEISDDEGSTSSIILCQEISKENQSPQNKKPQEVPIQLYMQLNNMIVTDLDRRPQDCNEAAQIIKGIDSWMHSQEHKRKIVDNTIPGAFANTMKCCPEKNCNDCKPNEKLPNSTKTKSKYTFTYAEWKEYIEKKRSGSSQSLNSIEKSHELVHRLSISGDEIEFNPGSTPESLDAKKLYSYFKNALDVYQRSYESQKTEPESCCRDANCNGCSE